MQFWPESSYWRAAFWAASSVRSASSEQERGAHSGGLRTTVQPAASAGAVFHVESMKGAFQGVMTAAGPAAIRWTRFQVSFERQSRSVWATARSAYAR